MIGAEGGGSFAGGDGDSWRFGITAVAVQVFFSSSV
jgi:hypothetical protein